MALQLSTFAYFLTIRSLCGIAVAYILLWVIYTRFFHPLAKYPGPFLASVTRLWLIFDVAGGSTEKTQRQLHKAYGHIVRIAPNELSISDPEAIKIIYGTHNGFKKTDFYRPFRPSWGRFPDHFTNENERQHAERRKYVNSLYSISNMIQMEDTVDRCIEQLVQKLGTHADRNAVIDFADWSQWFAFDVVGELFFGRMFGFMRDAHDYKEYISTLEALVHKIALALVMPAYMRPFFMLTGALSPKFFKALQGFKYMEKEAESRVTERRDLLARKPDAKPQDMLQRYFGIMHNHREENFGLQEIKTDMFGSLIAGSDTTASTITAILYYLLRTPDAYRKAAFEIEEAAQSGFLSPIIQYNEAVGLSYVIACIKEGMRLHPAVGFTMPRHIPKGGCKIAGQWFAEGTRVGMNAAVVQRDEKIFGENADDFVPERWLGKNAARMQRYMLQFGGGTRICIGKNISLCEIYKVISQLLRDFDMELAYPEKEWVTRNFWFNKPSNFHVRLRKRATL